MRTKLNRTNIKKLETKTHSYYVADDKFPAFRIKVTPAGTRTFYLLYRNAANKQITYKLGKFGELTPEQARDIAQKKMAEIKLGGDPAKAKQENRVKVEREKHLVLESFIDNKFEPWALANRKTGADMVARIKSAFKDYLQKQLPDLNKWVIEKWRKEKLANGRKPGTVNRDVAYLKSALSKAVEWGVIGSHPLQGFKLLKEDNAAVVRYLTDNEEKQLRIALQQRSEKLKQGRISGNKWRAERGKPPLPKLGEYGDHLLPMVLISINTGMRRGELFHLTWADVDLQLKSLVVHGEKAKSGKTRHIPLNSEAVDTLKQWKKDLPSKGLVFPNQDGNPFDNVDKAWAAVLEDAGITRFRWHDLRHTFASKLVMAGVDLNTVRELMGHSDLKMTLRYAHLAPEVKQAAVAKLVGG